MREVNTFMALILIRLRVSLLISMKIILRWISVPMLFVRSCSAILTVLLAVLCKVLLLPSRIPQLHKPSKYTYT